jgi:hypothetical protein
MVDKAETHLAIRLTYSSLRFYGVLEEITFLAFKAV